MAYGEAGYTNEVPRPIAQPGAAPAAEEGFMGMKWSDITKALQNPNVQRGIAQIGRQASLGPVDPLTGKRTEGVGSGMADMADKFIQGSEFQMNAAKQAEQKQLYDKAILEMFKQRAQGGKGGNDLLSLLQGPKQVGAAPQAQMPSATSSVDWLSPMNDLALRGRGTGGY